MIGICFWAAATKNRRIPETATGQPAVESPKRVRDRQTGQPSFVLGGQYPITAYYVNSSPASRPSPTTYKGVVCSTSLELGLLKRWKQQAAYRTFWHYGCLGKESQFLEAYRLRFILCRTRSRSLSRKCRPQQSLTDVARV